MTSSDGVAKTVPTARRLSNLLTTITQLHTTLMTSHRSWLPCYKGSSQFVVCGRLSSKNSLVWIAASARLCSKELVLKTSRHTTNSFCWNKQNLINVLVIDACRVVIDLEWKRNRVCNKLRTTWWKFFNSVAIEWQGKFEGVFDFHCYKGNLYLSTAHFCKICHELNLQMKGVDQLIAPYIA